MGKIIAVAFDLNQQQSAELFAGVSDYAREKDLDWQILPLSFGFEARLMELADSGKLDGVIGTFVSDAWVKTFVDAGIPAVNVFNFSDIVTIPSVSLDDYQIGIEAAAHLEQQGATEFAFWGSDGIHSTRMRAKGFAQQAPGETIEFGPNSMISARLKERTDRNKRLGVFCASDNLARRFITEANTAGYRILKDYLIVGVDNDPAESIFAGVEISSFALPVKAIGRTAAIKLEERLETPALTPEKVTIPNHRLYIRASSLPSPGALTAQRARQHLESNLSNPELSVESLATIIGSSRRSLELHFKQQFNTSPYQFITQLRLSQAERLLRETSFPIMEIGRRCGYPEPHHFSVWFKKLNGVSPKHFRKSIQQH